MRRTGRARWPVAALTSGVASLVALAACSGSTDAPLLDSGTASAPLTSATGSPSGAAGELPGAQVAQRVRQAMTDAGSARFSLQSSTTSGQDADGAINLLGGSTRVSFNFTDGSDRLRVIALPGILYADVGEVVDGRHWLAVRAGATDPVSSTMAPLLSYMTSSADVSGQATSWTAAAFTASGTTTISGVPVTEYDATIPQAAVRAGLPPQFRDVMKKDVTGDSHLRLWLDRSDRPVKLVTSGSYDHRADLVTVTYSDWGSAPKVTAPPSSDVIVRKS